jgi:hypothetical protein
MDQTFVPGERFSKVAGRYREAAFFSRPGGGKFTIPVPSHLALLKQSVYFLTTPIRGRDGIYREVDTRKIIVYDRAGRNTSFVSLISHPQGRIETAFPGMMELQHSNIQGEEQEKQSEQSA